jgi:PAS domain S-box-containing protein
MADLPDRSKEIDDAFKDIKRAARIWRIHHKSFLEAPLGMVLLDKDGNYLEANHEFCRILRRIPADVVGHNWREFTHPDDIAGDAARIEFQGLQAHGEDHVYQATKYFLTAGGKRIATRAWVRVLNEVDDEVKWCAIIEKIEDGGGS